MPVTPSMARPETQTLSDQNASVQGTLAMEGLSLDPASVEIGRRYDAGEITLEQFSAAMQAHVASLTSQGRRKQEDAA
jgi:hypothetical protein